MTRTETLNLDFAPEEDDESLAQFSIEQLCNRERLRIQKEKLMNELKCKENEIEEKFWKKMHVLYQEKEFSRARKKYLEIKSKYLSQKLNKQSSPCMCCIVLHVNVLYMKIFWHLKYNGNK